MCLRERREEQEVTGRAEQPRLRGPRAPRPGPPQLAARGASPPVRGAPTEFGSSPTSAATCVRTRKDVREEEGVIPKATAHPPLALPGAGSSAQVAAHQAQCGSGTRRADSGREPRRGLLPGTRVHPAGLHACPAGPSRVTAQDAP